MIKNYFKIALRNIVRHKAFSIINISGLAIGIAWMAVGFKSIKQHWQIRLGLCEQID